MNKLSGPNLTGSIRFVLGQVRFILSLSIMNILFGPQGVHNKRP